MKRTTPNQNIDNDVEDEEEEDGDEGPAFEVDVSGPINEPVACTLTENFLDECLKTFELLEDASAVIREGEMRKQQKLKVCQYLLQTLILDKVKTWVLAAHPKTEWFIKGISEVDRDPEDPEFIELQTENESVSVRIHSARGLDRVTLLSEGGNNLSANTCVYIMNAEGRWRGEILQKHRKFLEGMRGIRHVLLIFVKQYLAHTEVHKDPEKLWNTEFRDLIITAKRSYLCKRENERVTVSTPAQVVGGGGAAISSNASVASSSSNTPASNTNATTTTTTSKPKTKRRREQTPAAGSRASIAANRELAAVSAVEFENDDQI